MRNFCILIMAAFGAAAAGPRFDTSSASEGFGVAFPADGYRTSSFRNGPAFAGKSKLHLHRFLAAAIGVENYLLGVEQSGRYPVGQASWPVTSTC